MSAKAPLHIGTVTLDRPRIVLAATDAVSDAAIASALPMPFDLWELRIDGFQSAGHADVLHHVRRFKDRPRLATIRAPWEGGAWRGSEPDRLALYEAILPEVDAIDIEIAASEIAPKLISSAAKAGKTTIASFHAFDAFPGLQKLQQALDQADLLGADIAKVATAVATEEDLRALAKFTLDAAESRPVIVIAMGALGALSRIFFPALGSCLTYTHLGESTAPGQLGLADTIALMQRFYPR